MMKAKAVRLHGVEDVRYETIDLPEITEDEILVKVMANSICMSTYKAAKQGAAHKRVPEDVAEHPVITGHEMSGIIVAVGATWRDQFKPGQAFSLQPALNYKGSPYAPGYSYRYFGGNATYNVIPREVMELGCLLPYEGEAFYAASLGEPMSCIIGGFHANYHTKPGTYTHLMGIKPGGRMIVLGGAGPMGLGAIDYALALEDGPSMIVVTDIDGERLMRAAETLPPERAQEKGVALHYVNTSLPEDPIQFLRELTGGDGFDDAFVYAPVKVLVEQADRLLANDGCLNFFAGPTDHGFAAPINLYNVHYASTHVMGSTGGTTGDLEEALRLMAEGKIDPSVMITHIGGLDAAAETILRLPELPGGKKLVYPHIEMPLTAIADFEALGKEDPLFAGLHEICQRHGGLWHAEAEKFLFDHFKISKA
jgi:threonine dehydrogenase-like Zn-dependent dehydrogenase